MNVFCYRIAYFLQKTMFVIGRTTDVCIYKLAYITIEGSVVVR